MAVRVAVEDGLDHVKRALIENGFEVAKLTTGGYIVIEAAGMTAGEVVRQVKSRTVHSFRGR